MRWAPTFALTEAHTPQRISLRAAGIPTLVPEPRIELGASRYEGDAVTTKRYRHMPCYSHTGPFMFTAGLCERAGVGNRTLGIPLYKSGARPLSNTGMVR